MANIFLKYGDIKGGVTEPAHRSWIELVGMQWGVGRGPLTPNSPRESSAINELVVIKRPDRASPQLGREAVGGKPVFAVIDYVRDDGSVNIRYEMLETLISTYKFSGGAESPMEWLTLNFKEIKFTKDPGTPPP